MTTALTVMSVIAGAAGAIASWRIQIEVMGRPWSLPLCAAAGGLVAAAATGLVFLVMAIPLAGLGIFGILHLGYLGLCVSVPIVGATLLTRTITRRLPRWSAVFGAGLLLPVPVGWYATHVEPYRLAVDEATYKVDPARSGDSTVRIGVLADLQTDDPGGYEERAVERLLRAEPDIILMPGDLFQGSPSALDRHEHDMRQLLGRLQAPAGVYFVRGDTDHFGYPERILGGTDVVVLDDEIVEISIGDRRILLGGTRLNHRTDAALAMVEQLNATPGDDTIRILLAHRPGAVLNLPEDSRIDLTVAGHTHGGQVVAPGLGPLITMSDVPRHVARGGLHQLAGNSIYVSTGVGLERGQAPQIRLLSRPTLGVIDLVEPSDPATTDTTAPWAQAIGLRNVPMPSMVTSTMSPGAR